MSTRGWVYVITNQAMPCLVKVGFSMKDPVGRAQELGGTGNPHPYEVIYDVLVPDPRSIERRVHRSLEQKREGKEWFRIEVNEAISEIRSITSNIRLLECFSKPILEAKQESLGYCNFYSCQKIATEAMNGAVYCLKHWEEQSRIQSVKRSERKVEAFRRVKEQNEIERRKHQERL